MSQTSTPRATEVLRALPDVVEMHATTGEADLLVKVVARDTGDLHRLTNQILGAPGVVQTSTTISLCEEMPLRIRAVIEEATKG
ncbi:Lrp/AsnC ligand binding domain-containing protein [Streptomyces sp. NBC_01602]|uniref:Lrp/AsnC ligand binding domain-containing protein n=1 Tax=Streptomyces sp. NBC_01602 TaxID=2975893 RepID=UPI00386D3079|nr:Lrp/AsnC ligand binding domain-containing protein [Streptomyces sp. NBC_01602]